MSHRLPYGEGVFRRRFFLQSTDTSVVADMEDDFHRFRVELVHDGVRVTDVRGDARRHPWTGCPGALEPLRALVGMELSESPTATARHTNPRINCTHLFDVASLAVTHAAAGRDRRQFDIAIPDRVEDRTRPQLSRDGAPLLEWEIDGHEILKPHAGISIRGGAFLAWAEETFPPELAEAAIALRRACFISLGRTQNLDDAADATFYMPLAKGSCHVFQTGIAEKAIRVKGTSLEFTHREEELLADVV